MNALRYTHNRPILAKAFGLAFVVAAILALYGCASGAPPRPSLAIESGVPYPEARPSFAISSGAVPLSLSNGPTSGAEFFSTAAYGVSASPRIGTGIDVPRGGGYFKIGSPYTVAGRRYYPTSTPARVQKGRASWYGAAFHGRKTANGEIYDMNHLTAAHKTMPLPSYARVTNLNNNHTIVVRVNDRGPFSNNRIIDLSKRAADLLDYTKAGTAQVKVEYLGPAPLHGQDDAYLISTFRGAQPGGFSIRPRPIFARPALVSAYAGQNDISAYATKRIQAAFGEENSNTGWKR